MTSRSGQVRLPRGGEQVKAPVFSPGGLPAPQDALGRECVHQDV
jgi:hypothetical protein